MLELRPKREAGLSVTVDATCASTPEVGRSGRRLRRSLAGQLARGGNRLRRSGRC